MNPQVVASSFRDPSGFVYADDGVLYRQVNQVFADEFDACVGSGLYDDLTNEGLLVGHTMVDRSRAATKTAHAVLRPERLDFISYPYEWSFGQLKDAALLTLDIQLRALARGFTLRDASAYNVQFRDGRPVFIDTLSFERYRDGAPWSAYKQFCEHFLVPLALQSQRDARCGRLLRVYLDGIPLDLGSALLPISTWVHPASLFHIHLHARATRRYENAVVKDVARDRPLSIRALRALIDGLRSAVAAMTWRAAGTEWADYTTDRNYGEEALHAKRRLVREFVAATSAERLWDLGGNTGEFSRIALESARSTVCFDYDPAAVERNYRRVREQRETGILPLVLDLMNPSPASGWAHEERMSLEERGPVDAVMALALVHHLAISNNVPLARVGEYFARLAPWLVIEFVAKHDSQVQRLLRNRVDIFPDYTDHGFEAAFGRSYEIVRREPIGDAARSLYLMRRRESTLA